MALIVSDEPYIPFPTTSLIGRESTADALRELVLRHDVRLLTLTGPGGVGKSRIALHLIETLRHDSELETCLVLLSNATTDQVALSAVACAMGLPQTSLAPMEEVIAQAIGRRNLLLVLDNVEQLADSLTMIPVWLAHCPGLTILTTSRVMLRLSAEHVYPIDPLPTRVTHDHLSPAATLFIERAMAVQPQLDRSPESLAAINDICQRLDGLPLAIELAAARTRFLSPLVLRDRLSTRLQALTGGPRDAPERHRTLRATIAWSYDLLDNDERRMFERIAMFDGGAPFEAALVVGNACNDLTRDPEDVLSSLADHSLVRMIDDECGVMRVRMLQTLREFAVEQIKTQPNVATVKQVLAEWFADMVTREPDATWRTGSAEMRAWTARALPEFNNFRLSMAILIHQQEYPRALHMFGSLVHFLTEIGQLSVASEWAEPLLPHIDTVSIDVQARAARTAAVICMMNGDAPTASIWAKRAVECAIEIGQPRMIANNENLYGQILWQLGQPQEAERYQRQAMARVRAEGDPLGGALFGYQIAEGLIELGNLDRAESILLEGLPVIERHRPEVAPLIEGSLAQIALARDDLDRAGEHLEAALAYHQEPPHRLPNLLAARLFDASDLASRRGMQQPAIWLVGACSALLARVGHTRTCADDDKFRRVSDLAQAIDPTYDLQAGLTHGESLIDDVPYLLNLAASVARQRVNSTPVAPIAATISAETDGLLTPREVDVLILLDEGLSNAAIAERLFISQRTVTTHLSRLYAKLDVSSRTEAIAHARRSGLLDSQVRTPPDT